MNIELLDVVLSDLEHVSESAWNNPSYHALRRLSVQLRSLLIEDNLQKAWREVGMEKKSPSIRANKINTNHLGKGAVAFSAGGNYGGMQIGGVMIQVGEGMSFDELRKYSRSFSVQTDLPLHEFKDSISAFIHGCKIKRYQIIAYIAHKRGGAHLDIKRRKDDEAYRCLDMASSSMSLGGDDGGLEGHDAVTYELMSIAQNLTDSEDIKILIDRIRIIAGR